MKTRFIAVACASALALATIVGSWACRAEVEGQAAPLRVYAAGSTRGILAAIAEDYTKATGQKFELTFGPAGLLLDRIRKDGGADVYVSANMAHPQRLFAEGLGTRPVIFARNRLCVTGRAELGLTQENLLHTLLEPSTKIGTSTPGADPGGDYAWQFFDRAEAVRAGAKETLVRNAHQLVGGPTSPKLPAGETATHYFFSRHEADVFIGYCSSHTKLGAGTERPSDLPITRDRSAASARHAHQLWADDTDDNQGSGPQGSRISLRALFGVSGCATAPPGIWLPSGRWALARV